MNELTVHPNVYATGRSKGLVSLLERVWLREHEMGDGTLYIVSGFANYNGGVRFFPVFRRHIEQGGQVVAILLNRETTRSLRFSWDDMLDAMFAQGWDFHRPALSDEKAPAWQLLYDEQSSRIVLDETHEVTMILRLGRADTVRINARPKTAQAQGTQYFWLSRDCYDFFPPLTTLNRRGYKKTYSCLIELDFVDLGCKEKVRVTFEAENNLDFRLGTGPLRYSGLAQTGDLAAISRVGETRYELRLYGQATAAHRALTPYAIHFIGNRGKQYGFISNQEFQAISGTRVGRSLHS